MHSTTTVSIYETYIDTAHSNNQHFYSMPCHIHITVQQSLKHTYIWDNLYEW